MSPRTKTENQKIRERSIQSILDAAVKIFNERGYHASTVAEIASEAGISKGLIYNYFDSKQAILYAIFDEAFIDIAGTINYETKGSTPQEKLKNIIIAYFKLVEDNEEYFRLLAAIGFQPQIRDEVVDRKMKNSHINILISKAYEIFAEMGSEDPMTDFYVFTGTIRGMLMHYLYGRHIKEIPLPWEAMKKKIIEMYCK